MLNQSKKSIPDVGTGSSVYLHEAQGTNAHTGPQFTNPGDWFEQFFSSSSEMLCIIDRPGNFRRVNGVLAAALGYEIPELNEQPLTNFVYPRDLNATSQLLVQAQEKNIQGFESRFSCSDGTVKWLLWSTTILEEGLMLAIVRDITQQKQAEEELRRNINTLEAAEERYKAFVHQSSEIIWRGEMVNPIDISLPEEDQLSLIFTQSWLAECNDHMAWFYGYKNAAEMTGKRLSEFFSPAEPNTESTVLKFIQEGYKLYKILSGHVNAQGHKRYFISNMVGVVEHGKLIRIWCTQNDITGQRKAEKALRDSEERYRHFIHQSSEGIWRFEAFRPIPVNASEDELLQLIIDFGYLAECNETISKLYGYEKASDMTGLHLREVVTVDEHASLEFLRAFIRSGFNISNYQLSHIDPQGNKRYFRHNLVGIVEKGYLVRVWSTMQEVTRQHQAEEANRYQANILDNLFDAVISSAPDLTIRSWNRAAENLYGLMAAEVIGRPIKDFVDLDYHGTNRDLMLQELYAKGLWTGEASFTRPTDGKRIIFQSTISLLKDMEGNVTDIIAINKDITDKELAQSAIRDREQALRISEERYRSVVHALGEGIVMFDEEGKIITSNRSAEEMMGIQGTMMEGVRSNIFYIHEDGSPFPLEEHPSTITLKTGQSLQNVIMGIHRPDGALIWISVNTEPIYYNNKGMRPDAVVASFVDITQKKAAEIELQHSQHQLREYSERITNILDSITDGFIAIDKNFNILLWNHAVENVTGIKANVAIGANIEKVFPEFIGSTRYQQYVSAIESGTTASFEHFIGNYNRWFETSVYPFGQGVFIYFKEITERKKQEELLKLEKEVLKINAQSTVSLKTTIDYLLEGLEKTFPGMVCSVLVLNEDKETVYQLSAPSMPIEYNDLINGIRIGPKAGSCGTAMYRKEKVITVDIQTDPLWEECRHVMVPFNLRACWSFPVINARNEVLATIAAYWHNPRVPLKDELNILERVSNLLRIIIENKNAEVKIRVSNERYLLVTKATNDAIWDWDMATNTLYWGEGFFTLFGYKPGYLENSLGFWEKCIHDDDREWVLKGMNQFIRDNNSQTWEAEYRFKKANGKYALVYDRGFLIFDHTGKINRMVGSMQDITEKKEMERKLLKQELDKQKLVAQAVVNAQEKERADIGKELHDNVNQILSTAKLYLDLAKTEERERLDLINRSTDNISNAINEIRSISRSLVPASVGDLGLIDSIQDLVENVKATKKLQVSFYYEGEIDELLDEKRKLMLFRIVQEQVNNILRHSKATNLRIVLVEAGHLIDLTITDDGQGFDMEKVKLKKGVGLSNIISRAELFNGKVAIQTAPGKGCSLHINVPISNL